MLNGAVKCIVQRYNNTPVELYYAASPIFIWRVARSVHNHSPFDIPFDIANSAHVSFARYSDCAQTYGTRQVWSYIARPFQSPYDESPNRCTTTLHLIFHSILRTQPMFHLQCTTTVHKLFLSVKY